jgi:glucosamine--fructose-6-phosphate aminotransferase (isomerizing)
MCGISGCLGNKEVISYILNGLRILQNRGYDSAGCCCLKDGEFIVRKCASVAGSIMAVEYLESVQDVFSGSYIGIGHTRWATHGAPTDINSHPHLDYTGRFALVHNGIIENYRELKKFLIEQGVAFKSDTDTEVIVNLIGFYYQNAINHGCVISFEEAVIHAIEHLEGTWGLVIMCINQSDRLVCARHGSPLLIGVTDDYLLVTSEQSGFANTSIKDYISLNDHDVVSLQWNETDGFKRESLKGYSKRIVTVTECAKTPGEYPYWMIKEIMEQPNSALRAMGMGGRILSDNSGVKLGGFEHHKDKLMEIEHLIITGCGTSFYAGCHGSHFFKDLKTFTTVQALDGGEFTEKDIPLRGRTAMLILSQSGETMDLRRCMEIGRSRGLFLIGVVNVVDSYIAREVDCGVYLNASREVAVASTKSYTSQVIVLVMIAIWFAQNRYDDYHKERIGMIENYIKGLRQLPSDIRHTLEMVDKKCKEVAERLTEASSCFVLGKNEMHSIAMESSLKLKEVGYIHCESGTTSGLKHGPYSLLTKEIPVIILNPENFTTNKLIRSTMEEIRSRDALVCQISDVDLNEDICSYHIKIAQNPIFYGLLSVLPIQLISYYMAISQGRSPDMLRNLAKCVTVKS